MNTKKQDMIDMIKKEIEFLPTQDCRMGAVLREILRYVENE